MTYNSDQERFWAEEYSQSYMNKNSSFDHVLGAQGWERMLAAADIDTIETYLECGCNIGRNLEQIKLVYPDFVPSAVEINGSALDYVKRTYSPASTYHGAIIDCPFDDDSFDLVFTQVVLIHINPDQLIASMRKMYDLSKKYILIGEYFNRTPTSITYQGEEERLFKRDFGKLFMQTFNVKLLDYGFLWGHIYDAAGHDDVTWWLFEKQT